MGFLPSCEYVSTTVWRHHLNANKTHREKPEWELQENDTSYLEQILEQDPTKQQLHGHLPLNSQTI